MMLLKLTPFGEHRSNGQNIRKFQYLYVRVLEKIITW